MGKQRNAYRVLMEKPEGRRPLGRPRHRWEDNIKMDLKDIRWEGLDWIRLSEDRASSERAVLNTVVNIWVVYNEGNFLTRSQPYGVS
jgi:hypothetical protein